MRSLLKVVRGVLPVAVTFLIFVTLYGIRKEQVAQGRRLDKVEIVALFMTQKLAPEIANACNEKAVKNGWQEEFMDTHVNETANFLLHQEDEGNISALVRVKSEGLQCDFVASYGAVVMKLRDTKAATSR